MFAVKIEVHAVVANASTENQSTHALIEEGR